MKILTNWRYYVMAMLFIAGFLCMALAFGDDNMPMRKWCIVHGSLFAAGVGSFALLGRCVKRWSTEDKTSEYTNRMKDYE